MKQKLLLILMLTLLFACNFPAPGTPMITPTIAVASPTPVNMPGLVVIGHVTLNGAGVASVKIYKRFAAYPRELIATTDENGYYESDFINIPGDEMVAIEAEFTGYAFEPPYYYWRHYHGYEITTCDFVARTAP